MEQSKIWTTLSVLAWTKEYLSGKGIENARLEAEWLLCAATGLDRVGLYLQYDKPLSDEELAGYRAMVMRRARREPLQHILGTQEFYGLDFDVSSAVLVPRHDTEVLISESVSRQPGASSILDIGTGSGCIAVALARQFPNASVTATDISEAALEMARHNADRHGVVIEFLHGSLFDPLVERRFDLIVSNPPYIPTADIEGLAPEVREYDPRGALDGGTDGLDIYRMLIPTAQEHLNCNGWLLLEVGSGQAADVMRIFNEAGGYAEPFTALDPGGIERVAGAQRKEII